MGRTITTYLLDGSAQGAQYVSISNRLCKMLVIPRAKLAIINQRSELENPAFYILLGEDDNIAPKAYIGETENFKDRIKNHDYNKPFWQKALVFISQGETMTKADVQYLEFLAVKTAKKAKRFNLDDNKQTPKAPNLPEHQEDSIKEFFEDIIFLTSFISCPIFNIIESKNNHLFYTKSKGADLIGFYDENGFTVLKGSTLAEDNAPSLRLKEKRCLFIKEYTIKKNGKIILNCDYNFSSPSMASNFCLGRSSNGWLDWMDKDGRTLDEVYRKKLE